MSLVARLARLLPPETAHRLAVRTLGLWHGRPAPDDPVLATRLFGLDFPNPVGVAAGFDKNAEALGGTFALGFGFAEVGAVTPRPQPGNPKPRLFRLTEDRAVINRMGFNSAGADLVAANLARRPAGILAVNLGKNKETEDAALDYAAGARALGPLVDLVVINVSSPNTPGLRSLQAAAALQGIVERVAAVLADLPAAARPALLVKVAPDLAPAERAEVAEALAGMPAVAGLVVANTTTARPASLRSPHRGEAGGLSGRPLLQPSTEALADFYRLTQGLLPLVGVGGIASGADAYAKIRAGASLVQLYTALVYEGPGLVRRIKRELAALLAGDGFAHVAEAVGAQHR